MARPSSPASGRARSASRRYIVRENGRAAQSHEEHFAFALHVALDALGLLPLPSARRGA